MDIKILKFLLAIFPTFLILRILDKFFWGTGLGRIAAIPFILIVNIFIIIVGFRVIHNLKGIYKSIVWITIILLTFILPVFLWPQESDPAVTKQIEYSVLAIKNYGNATKKDLDLPLSKGYNFDKWNHVKNIEGAPERYVVALYKYRHQIPLDGSYHVYRENEQDMDDYDNKTSIKSIDEIPRKLEPKHKLIWWILEILRK